MGVVVALVELRLVFEVRGVDILIHVYFFLLNIVNFLLNFKFAIFDDV